VSSDDGAPATTEAPLAPDEAALWAALRGGGAAGAREQLFTLHFPFARQLAKRHFFDRTGGDIEFADLAQLASTGLLEAIDRFDPSAGAPFRAYAARRITGAILDGIARMSELRSQISTRNRIRQERARSLAAARADTLSPLGAMQALTDLAVGLALGFMLEDGGFAALEEQPDTHAGGYESLAWKETVAAIAAEIERLPERDQVVIRQHYFNGLTFDQIGALLGLTRGRVSQLHRAAIEALRRRLPHRSEFHLER
jgi:RNA polymerase sigma factor for flagellar operon FliA